MKRAASSDPEEGPRSLSDVRVGAIEPSPNDAPQVEQKRLASRTSLAQEGQVIEPASRLHRAEVESQVRKAPREGDELIDLHLLVGLVVRRLVTARPPHRLDAEG